MVGVSVGDMMKMTLNEINILLEGYIDRREIYINDMMYVMHNTASLISLAVWGSDEFPKKTPRLRLRPMTEEEYNKKLEEETMAFIEMMRPLAESVKKGGRVNG